MALGWPDSSPEDSRITPDTGPRQSKRGADHVDIIGRDCMRLHAKILQRPALRFQVARGFHLARRVARRIQVARRSHVASRLHGNVARSVAQLAGARTLAGSLERSGQRHRGTAAAPPGGTARLFIRLGARGNAPLRGAAHVVDQFIAAVRSASTSFVDNIFAIHKSVNEL
jgi:hypothetical protein